MVQLQYRSEISFTESFRVAMPWTSVQSGERCERWGKSGGKGPTNNGLWRLMDTQGRYICMRRQRWAAGWGSFNLYQPFPFGRGKEKGSSSASHRNRQ